MEQEKRIRREIANSNERRRMESINAGFQTLKTLLPRRDGEKISKASILQQTSDFISQLQREKLMLSQQVAQYKIIVEAGGLKPLNDASFIVPAETCPAPMSVPLFDDVPHKKRRKYEAISTDSSDEGVGMMSDPETQSRRKTTSQYSSPAVVVQKCDSWCQTIDEQVVPTPAPTPVVVNASQEKLWEMEILQRQLLEIRLALDRERRLRTLLEDQLRNVEINRLQSLSRLSLLEYPSALQAVIPSPILSAAAAATTANYNTLLLAANSVDHSNNNLTPSSPSPPSSVVPKVLTSLTNCCVTPKYQPQQSHTTTTSTTTSSTPQSNSAQQHPIRPFASTLNAMPSSVSSYSPANQNDLQSPYANNVQSRQSLEVIVEAIRHLEGDQLFIEDSKLTNHGTQTSTNSLPAHQHHQPPSAAAAAATAAELFYTAASADANLSAAFSLFRRGEKC